MFKAIYRIRASLRFIPQTLKEKSIFPPPTSIIPSYSFAHLPARLEHKEADADEVNKDPGSHPKLFVVKPRFRPDALLKTEYDEALNLVNSLGEQRDGYHGTYFSEKESPRHNVVHSPAYRSTHADTFFGPGNGDIVKCHLNAEDSKCGVDAVFVNGILTGIPQRNFLAELSVPMYKRTRPVRICGTDGRYTFGAAGEAEIVAAGRGSSSRGFTSGAGETIPQLQRRRFPASKTHAVHQASKMHLPTEKDDRWLGLIRLDNNSRGSFNDQPYDEFAGDVEKIYRILRKFHSRVPKLELALQESGVTVRSGLTERVLNRCGDAGSLGYKFFVWASKQPGYSHSHDVYKSIIRILGKMRQFGAVWALIEEMRRENPQLITPQVFVVLMRRFASARMVKKAVKVLDEMPKYGCEPDEYVFGCLLDALCKNGSVKEAALLFEDMRVRFPPTIKHFTSLLYGWCKEGKLMEAKFVLVQMREAGFEPDIVVYNNLLNGYAVAGKMVDAFDLLQEMRRKKCHPNAASFTILIQALCGREKMEAAMQVFLDMERSGCEADVVTYTTLISGFCKWGKTEKGYELMDRMIQRGHAPNQTTYLHILNSHEKKDELEECVELVQEIQKVGCSPDLNIYNTIIRLAFKLGEVKEGVRVWNQMEADGLSPGLDNFVNMIHGLIDQECLVEASDYFKEMVGRGLLSAPQYGLLKKLLNSLLRADKLQVSKDVWGCITNKGCELNVYAWTIWIHALFSKGHVKEACSYCLDMMDAGVMPQPDTFAKLMKGLRKLYNRQIAAEITEKVRQMAAERKITFKMYKRRGERDLKEKAKAKKDGRKTRARRRCWGRAKAGIV